MLNAATYFGVAVASVIDQNAPHGLCRNRDEMRAALPIDVSAFGKAQIRLVDESGGLKGMAWPFPFHVRLREPVQLIVHQRKEPFASSGISALHCIQQNGNVSG